MDRGDVWATAHRVGKSGTQLKRLSMHASVYMLLIHWKSETFLGYRGENRLEMWKKEDVIILNLKFYSYALKIHCHFSHTYLIDESLCDNHRHLEFSHNI